MKRNPEDAEGNENEKATKKKERKCRNPRKDTLYPCVGVCGERLPLLKIRQKKYKMPLTEIRWFMMILGSRKGWKMKTGLDLAFDIDDTVGGCFGLIEQRACFARQQPYSPVPLLQ